MMNSYEKPYILLSESNEPIKFKCFSRYFLRI